MNQKSNRPNTSANGQDDSGRLLLRTIDKLDHFVDASWRRLRERFGWNGVPKIQPYIGYANEEFAWFQGRVLTNPPEELREETSSWWENLTSTYQRFNSDEVPNVQVEIDFAGRRHRVISDKEGYFHLETPQVPDVRGSRSWQAVAMRIIDDQRVTPTQSAVTSRMLTPPTTAKLGVISDIDDTVLYTGMTGLISAAKLTFLHNARTRKPLPGVATLYNALKHGSNERTEDNPIFYVSSSPWNLFDLLKDFLDLNHIPAGPILLRDLGFDKNKFLKEGHGHKLEKTRKILAAYPKLPFVLFGDSGQEDSELYAQAAAEKPNQVKAIFIRDVDPAGNSKRDKLVARSIHKAESVGVPMSLVETSEQAASVLHQLGLISDNWNPAIAADVKADQAAPVER